MRHDHQSYSFLHQPADGNRPDGFVHPGQQDGRRIAKGLRGDVYDGQAAQQKLAAGRCHPGGQEPVDERDEGRNHQQTFKLGLLVELCKGPGDQQHDDGQNRAADDLQGEGRVQEDRLVTAFAGDNRAAKAEIREQADPRDHHHDERHQSEGFREQETRQKSVVTQAAIRSRRKTDKRNDGATGGPGGEPIALKNGGELFQQGYKPVS